jgi:8-oxo-dGTP diphosphatase
MPRGGEDRDGGRFQVAIGALIRRASDGRYLLLRRSAAKDFAAGMWECITGRVDQGEDIVSALHREVAEELGVSVAVDYLVGTFHFFRGPAEPANEMVGLHFCCSVESLQAVALSWEHSEYRWVTAAEADDLLPTGHWLRAVLERAEAIRKLSPDSLVEYRWAAGFSL